MPGMTPNVIIAPDGELYEEYIPKIKIKDDFHLNRTSEKRLSPETRCALMEREWSRRDDWYHNNPKLKLYPADIQFLRHEVELYRLRKGRADPSNSLLQYKSEDFMYLFWFER